jgi:hypothetical protein
MVACIAAVWAVVLPAPQVVVGLHRLFLLCQIGA